MLILTNFPRFPSNWQSSSGLEGKTLYRTRLWDFLRKSSQADLILINCNLTLVMELAVFYLLFPLAKKPIIAVDLVLRRPLRLWNRWTVGLKRFLLSRVDHFIHYFRDLKGYEQIYRIGPSKSAYLPFKANIWGQVQLNDQPKEKPGNKLDDWQTQGCVVLCAGRSLRDYDTFFAAMEGLPVPGAIPEPDFISLIQHGARFTRRIEGIPRNISLLPDDGSARAWIENLKKARILVLPTLKSSLCASGISTYLDGMLLGKCVIISEGPGASDVLRDGQAVIIPAEDPAALREAILNLWSDEVSRCEIAARGRRYALEAGSEEDFLKRVLEHSVDWWHRSRKGY